MFPLFVFHLLQSEVVFGNSNQAWYSGCSQAKNFCPEEINQTNKTEFKYGISEMKNWKLCGFDFQERFIAFQIKVKRYRCRMSLTIPEKPDKDGTDKSFIKKEL